MRHIEVSEIPRECCRGFPGNVEQSFSPFATVVTRPSFPLPLSAALQLLVARLCVLAKPRLCVIRCRSRPQLSCNSLEHSAFCTFDFLAIRWNTAAHAFISCRCAGIVCGVDCICFAPAEYRGKGEIVPLRKKYVSNVSFLLRNKLIYCYPAL